jgi:hypothetical protein
MELIGEGLYVGDGPTTYVVLPYRITTNASSEGWVGFSVFTVAESGEDGWVVVRHSWIGDLVR